MTRAVFVSVLGLLAVGCSQSAAVEKEKLEDAEFVAFVDVDGDGNSSDDQPRTIHLSDYYAKNRPGTKIIMLNAAAGWCGPCMHEAAKLSDFAASYQAQGVVVLTAVFQKGDASAADEAFTKLWAQTFKLSIPALVDSSFTTKRYFDVNTLPANMFVDANTTEILTVATGAKPGDDPLKEYRDLLDHYLQSP
jgi:thiol-disulfide isomerase/thioredoxin